jgi:AraC-like DNA-binding protein
MPPADDPAVSRPHTAAASATAEASAARWILPGPALASCVRACLTRDVARSAGARLPPAPDRCINRFPAHAYCSLTWFFEDAPVVVVPADDAWAGRQLPRALFSGPRSRPLVTRHTGRMRAFTLVLYPQAVHALTGLPIAEHIDRFTPLDELLAEPWQALSRQVLSAAGHDERVALIEQFLAPRWQACAPAAGVAAAGMDHDWVRDFNTKMLALAAHRSDRHLDRRIKDSAGQPLRRLRRLQRLERSFLAARAQLQAGTLSWAEIAADAGFADQAHLSREMREITGDSPRDWARKLVDDDEGYWAYRIWT